MFQIGGNIFRTAGKGTIDAAGAAAQIGTRDFGRAAQRMGETFRDNLFKTLKDTDVDSFGNKLSDIDAGTIIGRNGDFDTIADVPKEAKNVVNKNVAQNLVTDFSNKLGGKLDASSVMHLLKNYPDTLAIAFTRVYGKQADAQFMKLIKYSDNISSLVDDITQATVGKFQKQHPPPKGAVSTSQEMVAKGNVKNLVEYYEGLLKQTVNPIDHANGRWRRTFAKKFDTGDPPTNKLTARDTLGAGSKEIQAISKNAADSAQVLAIQAKAAGDAGFNQLGQAISGLAGKMDELTAAAKESIIKQATEPVKDAGTNVKLLAESFEGTNTKVASDLSSKFDDAISGITSGNIAAKQKELAALAEESKKFKDGVIESIGPDTANKGRVLSLAFGFDRMFLDGTSKMDGAAKVFQGKPPKTTDEFFDETTEQTMNTVDDTSKVIGNVFGEADKAATEALQNATKQMRAARKVGDPAKTRAAIDQMHEASATLRTKAADGDKGLFDKLDEILADLQAQSKRNDSEYGKHLEGKLGDAHGKAKKIAEQASDPVDQNAAQGVADVTNFKLAPAESGTLLQAQRQSQMGAMNVVHAKLRTGMKVASQETKDGLIDAVDKGMNAAKQADRLSPGDPSTRNITDPVADEAVDGALKPRVGEAASTLSREPLSMTTQGPKGLTTAVGEGMKGSGFGKGLKNATGDAAGSVVDVNKLNRWKIAAMILGGTSLVLAAGVITLAIILGLDEDGNEIDEDDKRTDQEKMTAALIKIFNAAVTGEMETTEAIDLMKDIIEDAEELGIEVNPVWKQKIAYLQSLVVKFKDNYDDIAAGRITAREVLYGPEETDWWSKNWWWVMILIFVVLMLIGLVLYFALSGDSEPAPILAPSPASANYGFAFL